MSEASKKTASYLSALGIVNALGSGKQQVLENFLAGDQSGMVKRDGWMLNQSCYVGEVNAVLPEIPEQWRKFRCRNNQLLLAAYEQIQDEIHAVIATYGKNRVAVVLGSSTSGIREGEKALQHFKLTGEQLESYHYKQQEIGSPAEFLAGYLNLTNAAYTVSTACSSSAKAFLSAQNLLAIGVCDAVIVGGVDSLCQLTVSGFHALSSVSSKICNPFSVNRDGINIGEAAALFLMTREPAAIKLCAVGESSDAHHISAPHPEGEGAERAMRAALASASLSASQIDYVNLHGTATPKNDAMESKAINRVFGSSLPCSSTKSLVGHTLGAAGATEAGLAWLLLSELNAQKILPKQVWDGCMDPALADIGLLTQDQSFANNAVRRILSNSFAFGGSNASVILEG